MLLSFILSAGGCASRPAATEQPKPLPRSEWHPKLQTRAEYWGTYQAKLHIRAESAKGKFHVQTVILAKLPDQFRLEAFNLWGQTLGVLVLNQGNSSLWVPSEKVLFTAARPETLIEHFLGIPIPIETLGYSLVASISPDQLNSLQVLPGDASGWTGYFKDPRRNWTFTWQFSAHPFAMKSIGVREAQWDYTISYEPAVDLDLQMVPKKIDFVSSQWQMEVIADQISKSSEFQAAAFNPPFPSGIRKVDLDIKR